MKLKPWQKNILSMLVIIGVGFVLFNVAFLLAYFVSTVYDMIIMQFIHKLGDNRIIHFSWHYVYIILVLLLSWFVLRRRLNDLIKATFLTMPLIVILTEVGIQFYQWPVLMWVIGTVIVGAVLLYLYKTKRCWLYYFSTIYVTAVELFVMFSGMEI